MAGTNPDRGQTVSTVLGRRLGGELLRLREVHALKQGAAAEALTASVSKVAKMERGLVPMRDPDVRALCHLYGVTDEAAVDALLLLARTDRERRKAKGWWNQYPQLQELIEYVALEDIATHVRTWQLAIVPGLLQTAEYARALAVGNGHWADPDEIEPFVESRLARRARLSGDRPLQLWAVVHEGALRQLVGGVAVMKEQLAHLAEMTRQPNVKVQVIPYRVGAHPGMTSAFTVVSFGEPGALDVVHMDTTSSTLWLESDTDADRHGRLFDRIVRTGLGPQSSKKLIDQIAKEL